MDAPVAAVVDAGPEATNEAEIARYSDERTIDHEQAEIKVPKATLLKAVPKGAVVLSLKKGDKVSWVAEHNGYYRVTTDDPKDGSKKLMGWVVQFAFEEPPPPPKKIPVPKCASEELLASLSPRHIVPFCTKLCAEDSECPSKSCSSSLILDDKGQPAIINGDTHIETVCVPKEPAKGAKDAGAAADAGGDAGKTKPPAKVVPKCANDESLFAVDEKASPFCGKGDGCSTDKDCGKGTCLDVIMLTEDGSPQLNAHGGMLGGKFCKPK